MKYINKLSDIINIVNDNIFESESVTINTIKRFVLFDKSDYEKINTFEYEGVQIDYIHSDTCVFDIKDNKIIIKNNKEAKKSVVIDFNETDGTLIYCKSGYLNEDVLYLLNKFIYLGFTVINNPDEVQISANKFITAKVFSEYNVPQPKYCIITKEDCDIDDINEDKDKLHNLLRSIYPKENENNQYVCKILNGHGGHGVFICRESNILSVLQCIFCVGRTFNLTKIFCQEKLEITEGDIRAYVLNINDKQEIVDCIIRKKSSDDFRTNISLGNTTEDYKLEPEYQKIVKDAAKASGLKFCGVDLCINENNKKAYVLEINGAPGAPTALNINEEENRAAHEKFYTTIINTINKMINV